MCGRCTAGLRRASGGLRRASGSARTVCHMPETAVYHMCRGELRRCLPTGWPRSSVSSITSTSTHCGAAAPRRRCAEISRLKGAYPPLCEPAFRPLTNTSVDRPKVQQHSATLAAALAAALALAATHAPRRGQHEGAAIAHALDRLCDAEARQRRLGCEGHEDTMREADATGQVGGYLLPLPPSVEAEPARALHLRPRVLR